MADLPEKIKAWLWNGRTGSGQWSIAEGEGVEYTRTDQHLALVAAAKREARNEALREAMAKVGYACFCQDAISELMEDTDDD